MQVQRPLTFGCQLTLGEARLTMQRLIKAQQERTRRHFIDNYSLNIVSGAFSAKTNNSLKVCHVASREEVQENSENFPNLPALLHMRQPQLPGVRRQKKDAVRKVQRKSSLKCKPRNSDRPRLVQKSIDGKLFSLSLNG